MRIDTEKFKVDGQTVSKTLVDIFWVGEALAETLNVAVEEGNGFSSE